MKYKKHIVAVTAASLVAVGGTSAYQLYPRQESIAPIATVITEPVEEETVPKPSEEVAPIEEVTNPAPLPASEPVVPEPPKPVVMSHEELWGKIMTLVAKQTPKNSVLSLYTTQIASVITNTYESKGRAFNDAGAQSDVNKCLAYLAPLDRSGISVAIATNNCGI